MEGVIPVGPELIEAGDEESVALDHDLGVAGLHGEAEVVEVVVAGDAGEFEGAFDHSEGGIPVAVHDAVGEGPVVGADAEGAALLFTGEDEGGKGGLDASQFLFVLGVGVFTDGEPFLVGVVPGVDPDFLHPLDGFHGRFGFEVDIGDDGDADVLGAEGFDDEPEVRGVLDGRGGDPDDLAAHANQVEGLANAFGGVHGVARDHGLHDDGVLSAELDPAAVRVADDDFAARSSAEGAAGLREADGEAHSLGASARGLKTVPGEGGGAWEAALAGGGVRGVGRGGGRGGGLFDLGV